MNLALAIPHATRSLDNTSLDSGSLDDRLSALRPKSNPILQQLRSQYPTGCLSADLVQIHQDQFVVRAVVQVDNVALVTALASASTIEVAEDRARTRVLEALGLNSASGSSSISSTLPIGDAIGSEVASSESEPTIELDAEEVADEKMVSPKVETTSVSKATKRKPKATPAVVEAVVEELATDDLFDTTISEAVEVVNAPEGLLEPIVETPIQPVAAIVELVVEPIVALIVESIVEPTTAPVVDAIVQHVSPTPVLTPIVPVSVQAAVEMATEPEELESVEMSFEVEEVYEYTYEGEEIPLEPTASTTSGRSETLEVAPTSAVVPAATIDYGLDLSDTIAQIGMEIDRIGWTKKQGSAYLQQTYSKRTRAELTETELFGFLNYLKSMPAKLQPELSQLPF
jgi:hypothetical protein